MALNQVVNNQAISNTNSDSTITGENLSPLNISAINQQPEITLTTGCFENKDGIPQRLIHNIPSRNLEGCFNSKQPKDLRFLSFFFDLKMPFIFLRRVRTLFNMHIPRWSMNKKFKFTFLELPICPSSTILSLCQELDTAYSQSNNAQKKQQIRNALNAISTYWLNNYIYYIEEEYNGDVVNNPIVNDTSYKAIIDILKKNKIIKSAITSKENLDAIIKKLNTIRSDVNNIEMAESSVLQPETIAEFELFLNTQDDEKFNLSPKQLINFVFYFQFLLCHPKPKLEYQALMNKMLEFVQHWLNRLALDPSSKLYHHLSEFYTLLSTYTVTLPIPIVENAAPQSEISDNYQTYNSISGITHYLAAFNQAKTGFELWQISTLADLFVNIRLIIKHDQQNSSAAALEQLKEEIATFYQNWITSQQGQHSAINLELLQLRYTTLINGINHHVIAHSLLNQAATTQGGDTRSASPVFSQSPRSTSDPHSASSNAMPITPHITTPAVIDAPAAQGVSMPSDDEDKPDYVVDNTIDIKTLLLQEINNALAKTQAPSASPTRSMTPVFEDLTPRTITPTISEPEPQITPPATPALSQGETDEEHDLEPEPEPEPEPEYDKQTQIKLDSYRLTLAHINFKFCQGNLPVITTPSPNLAQLRLHFASLQPEMFNDMAIEFVSVYFLVIRDFLQALGVERDMEITNKINALMLNMIALHTKNKENQNSKAQNHIKQLNLIYATLFSNPK